MNRLKNEKGIVLIMISGVALIIFIEIIGVLFFLQTNIRSMKSFKERSEAYYLCETGASIALLDIANGCIGKETSDTELVCRIQGKRWSETVFDYQVQGVTYHIHYKITKAMGQWKIVSWVGPDSGFSMTYKLRVGGSRAFPIFIRGGVGK